MTAFVAPEPDDATGPWWEATRDRRLLVQHCHACNTRQHPPRAVCIGCGRMDRLGWLEASGHGTVDAWTEVRRPPSPNLHVPYVIARVRLAEGPLLLTRLTPRRSWRTGEPVILDWLPLEDGRSLPVFAARP